MREKTSVFYYNKQVCCFMYPEDSKLAAHSGTIFVRYCLKASPRKDCLITDRSTALVLQILTTALIVYFRINGIAFTTILLYTTNRTINAKSRLLFLREQQAAYSIQFYDRFITLSCRYRSHHRHRWLSSRPSWKQLSSRSPHSSYAFFQPFQHCRSLCRYRRSRA